MHHKIPQHWRWVVLDDICFPPQYGWTTSSVNKGDIKLLRITDISGKAQINWETVPFAQNPPTYLEGFLLEKGDILIARSGNTAGVSFCLDNIPYPCIFASYLIRFKPVIIDSKYLHYFAQTVSYWQQITQNKAGNTIPNVNATKLAQLELPLPPLAEQQRIVTQLETQLPLIEQNIQSIDTKLADLKAYQQSVLEDAMSGKLTEGWTREKNISNGSEVSIESLFSIINDKFDPAINDIRNYIGLENMKQGGGLLEISSSKNIHSAKTVFSKGDILYGKLRPNLNKHFVATFDGVCSTDIIVLRTNNIITAKFIDIYFNSNRFIDYVISHIRGDLPRIKPNLVLSHIVYIPSLPEQAEIIRLVEEKLTQADELEKNYAAEIEKSVKLRQAILQRAFEGDLSEWQEGDESVEDLLERVKEERKVYQLLIQEKKKMKTNTTKIISLEELSAMIEKQLIEVYNDN